MQAFVHLAIPIISRFGSIKARYVFQTSLESIVVQGGRFLRAQWGIERPCDCFCLREEYDLSIMKNYYYCRSYWFFTVQWRLESCRSGLCYLIKETTAPHEPKQRCSSEVKDMKEALAYVCPRFPILSV